MPVAMTLHGVMLSRDRHVAPSGPYFRVKSSPGQ
jgi:hypothetical protein